MLSRCVTPGGEVACNRATCRRSASVFAAVSRPGGTTVDSAARLRVRGRDTTTRTNRVVVHPKTDKPVASSERKYSSRFLTRGGGSVGPDN